jgi:hypothetical protein
VDNSPRDTKCIAKREAQETAAPTVTRQRVTCSPRPEVSCRRPLPCASIVQTWTKAVLAYLIDVSILVRSRGEHSCSTLIRPVTAKAGALFAPRREDNRYDERADNVALVIPLDELRQFRKERLATSRSHLCRARIGADQIDVGSG